MGMGGGSGEGGGGSGEGGGCEPRIEVIVKLQKKTRIDVYETLCPQQMLVHKGGQINNVQLITGVGSADMPHLQNCSVKIFKMHCRYFTNKRK